VHLHISFELIIWYNDHFILQTSSGPYGSMLSITHPMFDLLKPYDLLDHRTSRNPNWGKSSLLRNPHEHHSFL
jgi:hypothetical protein